MDKSNLFWYGNGSIVGIGIYRRIGPLLVLECVSFGFGVGLFWYGNGSIAGMGIYRRIGPLLVLGLL